MPHKPTTHRAVPRAKDNARPTAAQRGYGAKWQRASQAYLRDNPLCVECQRHGRIEPATCVDHVEPHRGDDTKFWTQANWQPLCVRCHNRKTAKGE